LTYSSKANPSLFWTIGGEHFAKAAVDSFRRHGIKANDISIGFTAANLEVLRLSNSIGTKSIHVQIDPGLEWYKIRDALRRRYPTAEEPSMPLCPAFIKRISAEWEEAQIVACHSTYSQRALTGVGVSAEKIKVIKPGYISSGRTLPREYPSARKPVILFLGNVCLVKGFADFCELAERFAEHFEFHCAGKIHMSQDFLNSRASKVQMHGHLQPHQVKELMRMTDLLVFPSYSEGFGLVQLEAMDDGVPVLASHSCGDVVIDGFNGYRFQAGNLDEMSGCLRRVFASRVVYDQLSKGALSTLGSFTLECQFSSLMSLVSETNG
jgi:glycosyltransferase involved in cell wall biosynthesis